jgi:hypothetical protein
MIEDLPEKCLWKIKVLTRGRSGTTFLGTLSADR